MGVYCLFWIKLLPKWGSYQIRTETLVNNQDGSVTHRLRKVSDTDVDEWDRTHDESSDLVVETSATHRVPNEHLIRRVRVKETTTVNYEKEAKV
jgi:hypothetical protein